jgi:hypothetical protein
MRLAAGWRTAIDAMRAKKEETTQESVKLVEVWRMQILIWFTW